MVVRVVQANLVVAFLGPVGRAVKCTVDTNRLGGVEIFRVAHGVTVGILVVWVSASCWMQGLIVIDGVLHRSCRPLRNRLVYIF